MTQTTQITVPVIPLGDRFPTEGSFRFTHIDPQHPGRITGKVGPLLWLNDEIWSAAFVKDKPAIEQSVTCDVSEHWLPMGFTRSLVFPKLAFTPRIGDLIKFEGGAVYTVITMYTIVAPYIIMLDRPLEQPIRCDSDGTITEAITLRSYAGPPKGTLFGRPLYSRPLGSHDLLCGVAILDESLAVVMLS